MEGKVLVQEHSDEASLFCVVFKFLKREGGIEQVEQSVAKTTRRVWKQVRSKKDSEKLYQIDCRSTVMHLSALLCHVRKLSKRNGGH